MKLVTKIISLWHKSDGYWDFNLCVLGYYNHSVNAYIKVEPSGICLLLLLFKDASVEECVYLKKNYSMRMLTLVYSFGMI